MAYQSRLKQQLQLHLILRCLQIQRVARLQLKTPQLLHRLAHRRQVVVTKVKHSKVRTAFVLFAFFFSAVASASASWTDLARKVGESEDNRANVIAQLRHIPGLKAKLSRAIYSGTQRPLALDVISALDMKDMITDLLLHVPADPDGFLTVAVNSMMDPKNQKTILDSYVSNLNSLGGVSYAAQVAMLEPLGRLGVVLSRDVLNALSTSASPEVRSSLIYYLRMMALRNHRYENLELLAGLLKAGEFQIRMQVVSVSSEIGSRPGIPSIVDLKHVCETEKTPSIRAACLNFVVARAPSSVAPLQCSLMEKDLDARDTFKVRMVFGYKDARPARFVGDRHERLAFIEKITTACTEKSAALGSGTVLKTGVCGFSRSHDNADLFLKKVVIRKKSHRVLLWVVNSSVGTDDQENRDDPFQKWKSKYAEEAFTSGLHDADVVLYDGHSRFGGGPDFAPPVLGKGDIVDPAPYQTARPGLTKMTRAMVGKSRLKMLGLFSCSSSQHFNEEIRRVSSAGILSSKVLMYYSDALSDSLKTLADVLEGRCPRSISF